MEIRGGYYAGHLDEIDSYYPELFNKIILPNLAK